MNQDLLAGFPVVLEIPVAWAEMDAFRHVNNTVYFRWFESARIAYLDRIGMRDEKDNGGVGPILHSTHCRFRRPVVYPDHVLACARVTDLQEDRFVMDYRVISREQGEIAAEGGGIVVAYDYVAGRKAPVPRAVRTAIVQLEQGRG